ncbi:MAG: hypothetical protein R3A78_09820 [Polyangiales bacterium]|nr:hypothetical protein [Myxococcales bacterium]
MNAPEPLTTRERFAVAALVFAVAAPTMYVVHRLYEVVRGGGEDPALVLAQAHIGFYWRIASATWLGGTIAAAFFALARNADRARARVALSARVLPWWYGLLLVLAWWFP